MISYISVCAFMATAPLGRLASTWMGSSGSWYISRGYNFSIAPQRILPSLLFTFTDLTRPSFPGKVFSTIPNPRRFRGKSSCTSTTSPTLVVDTCCVHFALSYLWRRLARLISLSRYFTRLVISFFVVSLIRNCSSSPLKACFTSGRLVSRKPHKKWDGVNGLRSSISEDV